MGVSKIESIPLLNVSEVVAIIGTTPAAGVEISETVPTGQVWEVVGVSFRLVTNAVVGNRVVDLIMDDGSVSLIESNSATNQVATRTRDYICAAYGYNITTEAATIEIPLPSGIILPAGARIRTETAALDAGDQYSNVRILVRRSGAL